jgi:nucleoside-diphosphate-sugar epimerase
MKSENFAQKVACVTGAHGMVGSRIVRKLLSLGYRVRALSRKSYPAVNGVDIFRGDINDEPMLASFVQGAQILFHCAAELKNELNMWHINVTGTERILKHVEFCGIKYLCYLSSVGVVGNTNLKLVDELTPCSPQNIYEKSKWAAEQLVMRGIKGCKVVILRPTNVVSEEKPGILYLPKRGSWFDIFKVFLIGGECAHIVHAEDVAEAAVYFVLHPLETVQRYIVSYDEEPLNTAAGLWALYNVYKKGSLVNTVRVIPHLPIFVPYILRRIIRGRGNMGYVCYSSKKLRETGFFFKLGLQGAVSQIAASEGFQGT